MNPNQTGPAPQQPLFERLNYRAGCGALGVVMAVFGACGVVAFVSDLLTNPQRDQLAAGISLSFFFACAAGGGLFIARHYFRKPPRRPNVQLENRLLQVAYAHRARLTVPQVALHCQVSIEESRELLERMVSQGVAVPQVDDDGTITYFFDDLLPPHGAAALTPTPAPLRPGPKRIEADTSPASGVGAVREPGDLPARAPPVQPSAKRASKMPPFSSPSRMVRSG